QHTLGGLPEAVAGRAGHADRLLRGRRQTLGGQPHRLVPGVDAMTTAVAQVIGSAAGDLPQQAQRLLRAIVLELGGLTAARAGDAAAPVAVFFSAKWVCKAVAPS